MQLIKKTIRFNIDTRARLEKSSEFRDSHTFFISIFLNFLALISCVLRLLFI